jgi:hypothetical protein
MHEIPAWQIDMLLAGLQADEAVGRHRRAVDDELRADPDDGGAFAVLPPYLRS